VRRAGGSPTEELDALDEYERVETGLYRQVTIPLDAPGGHPDEAAVYVGDPDRLGADAVWSEEGIGGEGNDGDRNDGDRNDGDRNDGDSDERDDGDPGSLSGSTSTSNRKRFGCG